MIDVLDDHIKICGYGRVGRPAAAQSAAPWPEQVALERHAR
jgi:hypothetical protein